MNSTRDNSLETIPEVEENEDHDRAIVQVGEGPQGQIYPNKSVREDNDKCFLICDHPKLQRGTTSWVPAHLSGYATIWATGQLTLYSVGPTFRYYCKSTFPKGQGSNWWQPGDPTTNSHTHSVTQNVRSTSETCCLDGFCTSWWQCRTRWRNPSRCKGGHHTKINSPELLNHKQLLIHT